MKVRALLFLSLLFAVALGNPAEDDVDLLSPYVRMAKRWQLRSLRRAQNRLKNLEAELAALGDESSCDERNAEIAAAVEALKKARSCLYRGIGYREYSRLRILCKDRSEIRDELRSTIRFCKRRKPLRKMRRCFSRKVNPLKTRLKSSFEACRTIGWKGEGRVEREGCPDLITLKTKLADLRSTGCGRGARKRTELLGDIEKTKGRIAYLLGLIRPRPSSAPRMG